MNCFKVLTFEDKSNIFQVSHPSRKKGNALRKCPLSSVSCAIVFILFCSFKIALFAHIEMYFQDFLRNT